MWPFDLSFLEKNLSVSNYHVSVLFIWKLIEDKTHKTYVNDVESPVFRNSKFFRRKSIFKLILSTNENMVLIFNENSDMDMEVFEGAEKNGGINISWKLMLGRGAYRYAVRTGTDRTGRTAVPDRYVPVRTVPVRTGTA